HLPPHRGCERSTARARRNRRRLVEAEPDARDDIGWEADEPDVIVVCGIARLACHGNRGMQVAANARRGSPLHYVAHHVANDVSHPGIEGWSKGAHIERHHNFAVLVFYTVY